MVKVKFCGITSPKDALWAINMGVDFIGINLVKESPRKVSLDQAKKMLGMVPPFTKTVAVAADLPLEELLKTAKKLHFNYWQLHGNEDAAYLKTCRENGLSIIKTVKMGGETDWQKIGDMKDYTEYFLLDTKKEDIIGGTGESFDWNLAYLFKEKIDKPFFLAGGLTPENAAEAINSVKPWAVDVASGIEKSPRSKDFARMKDFITNARKAL